MGVEYNGSAFCGWQIQKTGTTVQEELEKAISRVANHPVRIHCAGRTDTGVHGIGQIIHFDTPASRSPRNWMMGCNVNLPHEISVKWAIEVPAEFHARFSAISRSYRYHILNCLTRSALRHQRAVWVYRPLDAEKMHQAAQYLLGTHDFSSFRAIGCQAKSPVRHISAISVIRTGEELIIEIKANAFLHHMVRNIAGVLMAIGKGEKPVEWCQEVLEFQDRTRGGVTAEPQGLYLLAVDYPAHFRLQERIEQALLPMIEHNQKAGTAEGK